MIKRKKNPQEQLNKFQDSKMGNELKLRKQNQINRVNIFTLPGDGYKIKDELEFLFLHSL